MIEGIIDKGKNIPTKKTNIARLNNAFGGSSTCPMEAPPITNITASPAAG